MEDAKQHTRISSVQKALKVLDFIATAPEGLEVKQIAYSLNINLSTCYHILNTLSDEEYVCKNKDGSFILGAKIPRLNNTFISSLAPEQRLVEQLHLLQKATGETAYLLGVKEENQFVIQAIVETLQAIRVNTLYVGYSGNSHARSATKVILAYWEESRRRRYFDNYEFTKYSDKTPANYVELKGQLERIRVDGFCTDEEEYAEGICCVSAPILLANGNPVGSFGITIPKERYFSKKQSLIENVVTAARKSSALLGYTEHSAR